MALPPGMKEHKIRDEETGAIIRIIGPEDATDEELFAAADDPAAAPEPGTMRVDVGPAPGEGDNPLQAGARFIGSSLARGVGEAGEFASGLIGMDSGPIPGKSYSPEAQVLLDKETALKQKIADIAKGLLPFELSPQPTTPFGKVADAGIRGAVGGAFAPGKLAYNAITGAAAGAGGMAGTEIAGEENPVAGGIMGVLGALLGGGGAHAVANSRTLRGAFGPGNAKEILAGTVIPELEIDLRRAAAGALEARQAGVPINYLDMLQGPENAVTDVQRALLAVGGANKTAQNLRQQPQALQGLANTTEDALPGRYRDEQSIANDVQDAATRRVQTERGRASGAYGATLDDSRTAARDMARQDLRQAGGEARSAEKQFSDNVANEIEVGANRDWIRGQQPIGPGDSRADFPGKTENVYPPKNISGERMLTAEREYAAAMDKVVGMDRLSPDVMQGVRRDIDRMVRDQAGDPLTQQRLTYLRDGITNLRTSKELHTFIRTAGDNLPGVSEIGSGNKAIKANAILGSAIGKLKIIRNEATPGYKEADDAYNSVIGELNSLKKDTDVGALAGPKGSAPDRSAAVQKVWAMLDIPERTKVPEADSRLVATLREVGKEDPEALQDLLKNHLNRITTRVFGQGNTGRPNMEAGKALTAELGDASQALNDGRIRNMRLLIDETARANQWGVSQRLAAQKGVDRLRELANANARAPQRALETGPRELELMAQDVHRLYGLTLIGAHPGWAIVRRLQPYIKRKTYEHLDRLISDPNEVEALIELGKASPMSARQSSAWAIALGHAAGQAGVDNSMELSPANP